MNKLDNIIPTAYLCNDYTLEYRVAMLEEQIRDIKQNMVSLFMMSGAVNVNR